MSDLLGGDGEAGAISKRPHGSAEDMPEAADGERYIFFPIPLFSWELYSHGCFSG